jgi:hypothetical protein
VPNSAASSYKTKALLHWSNVQLNGGVITAVGGDSVQIVAYLGDVTGDGLISAADPSAISRVAASLDNTSNSISGFSAYRLADPVILGDVANAGSVSSTDVSLLNSVVAGVLRAQVPTIPTGLLIVPSGPDPTLSLPASLQATPGSTVVVPVTIDDARPDGSTGMTEATLALRFDPRFFSVSAADVELGSLPKSGSGWQLSTVINAQTGEIGIDLFSSTPIQTADSGSLVTIALHVRDNAPAGPVGLELVNQVNPAGFRAFTTTVADALGAFVIHMAPESAQDVMVSGDQTAAPALPNMATAASTAVRPPSTAVQATSLDEVFGAFQESTFHQPAPLLEFTHTATTAEDALPTPKQMMPLAESEQWQDCLTCLASVKPPASTDWDPLESALAEESV